MRVGEIRGLRCVVEESARLCVVLCAESLQGGCRLHLGSGAIVSDEIALLARYDFPRGGHGTRPGLDLFWITRLSGSAASGFVRHD
jgi:hypothetical protein